MSTAFTTSQASAANTKPNNFTRRSASLARKFWRTGQWHLLPLYWLLRTSDLAREGMERSGSYRFADHLYRNESSGRLGLGRVLDRLLLNTRAACAMRARCAEASLRLEEAVDSGAGDVAVLALPCGIPRDITDLVRRRWEIAGRIRYTGMDIDMGVISAARDHVLRSAPAIAKVARWIHGNALNDLDYPEHPVDFVISTGLGEFLNDAELRQFYRNVFAVLKPGGCFFTSATRRERRSDYFLRAFELHTHYRTETDLSAIMAELPWTRLEYTHDATGLQTFALARR